MMCKRCGVEAGRYRRGHATVDECLAAIDREIETWEALARMRVERLKLWREQVVAKQADQ